MACGLLPLPSFLRASAQDAASMQMRRAGRTKWNDDDYNRAVDFLEEWTTHLFGAGNEGKYRFQVAEQMERAGLLTSDMSVKAMVEAVNEVIGAQWQEAA